MKRLNRALIDFVVRRFFRDQAGDDQDRIGPENLRRLDLPFDVTHRSIPLGRIAC